MEAEIFDLSGFTGLFEAFLDICYPPAGFPWKDEY
jgi:hypothetical protein